MLELASSDDLADAPGDQLARHRGAAVRCGAAYLECAIPGLTQVADWLRKGSRRQHRSLIASAWLAVACRRVLHARHSNGGIGRRCCSLDCDRYVSRGSLGPTGCATARASSARRAFRRRCTSTACQSSRDPRSRLNWPRLRAAECRRLRAIGLTSSRPSVASARKEEGENPRAFNQIETKPPGRWGNAGRSGTPTPQSKPVTAASRLVEQNCAVGGIRAGTENSGRRASTDTDSTPIARVYVNQTSKVCTVSSAHVNIGRFLAQRAGPAPTEPACAGIINRNRDRGDHIYKLGYPLTGLLNLIHPGAGLGARDPSNRHSECTASRSYKNIRSTSAHTRSSPTPQTA